MKKNGLKMAVGALLALLLVAGGAGCSSDGGNEENEKASVTTLSITAASETYIGGEITLTANVTPEDATGYELEWESDDTATATVEKTGAKTAKLTGQAEGVAVITVRIKDGSLENQKTITVHEEESQVSEEGKKETTTDETKKTEEKSGDGNYTNSGKEGISGETGAGTVTVTAGPTILNSVGWLESAYVTWTDNGATTYNVYYQKSGDSNWTKIDAPLIRKYKDYVRADILGLAAGTYSVKVDGGDASKYSQADNISVASQDRNGYAFTSDDTPGAYKKDGTLKDGAIVIYANKDNFESVKLTLVKDKKGGTVDLTGVQAIVDTSGYWKYASFNGNVPLDIRIIGKIDTTAFPKSSWKSSKEGLQVKGSGKVNTMVTIEGVGDDATLWGFGVLCRSSRYVEIKNLGFMCFADDGISLDTDNLYTWVHNNDVFYGSTGGDSDQAKGDGSLDVKGNSKYQTYSYNHFWDSGKMSLCGMKSESGPNYITYHHNWFDHSDSRHPRIRTMTVHVYNNYYDGNSKYGAGVTTGADAFVEANYFRNVKFPMMSSLQGNDVYAGTSTYKPNDYGTFSSESGGSIKSYNNKIVDTNKNTSYWPHKNSKQDPLITKGAEGSLPSGVDTSVHFDAWEASTRNEQVPATVTAFGGGDKYSNFDTDSSFYNYTADEPDAAKDNVIKYAGRIENGDFEFDGYGTKSTDATNATKDKDYSVDSALKSAVVGYTSPLVSIYDTGFTYDVAVAGGTGDPDKDAVTAVKALVEKAVKSVEYTTPTETKKAIETAVAAISNQGTTITVSDPATDGTITVTISKGSQTATVTKAKPTPASRVADTKEAVEEAVKDIKFTVDKADANTILSEVEAAIAKVSQTYATVSAAVSEGDVVITITSKDDASKTAIVTIEKMADKDYVAAAKKEFAGIEWTSDAATTKTAVEAKVSEVQTKYGVTITVENTTDTVTVKIARGSANDTLEISETGIKFPTKAIPAGTYTDGAKLLSDGYFVCGKLDGSSSGSLTTAATSSVINVLPTEYVSFVLENEATISFVAGNKGPKICSASGTAVYNSTNTGKVTQKLSAGRYYITSAHGSGELRIKFDGSNTLTVTE